MNNEAKYEALIASLSLAKEARAVRVAAYVNSKLVEGKVTSKYEVKDDWMKKYLTKVIELMSHFEVVSVRHIPRSQNEQADWLARLASDDKYIVKNELPVSRPMKPSMENKLSILICINEPKDY